MPFLTIIAFLLCAYMVATVIRTLIIHVREFKSAERDWNAAFKKGDVAAYEAAFKREEIAHKKCGDLLWLFRPIKGPLT